MPSLKILDEHRHATWLELFFDLVFVASIGVIAHHLSHAHHGHLDPESVLLYGFELVPVWWIWATHTFYANRYDADGRGQRVASLAVMFLMVTMSGFLGAGLSEGAGLFVGFYVAIRTLLGGMYLWSWRALGRTEEFARKMGAVVLGGAAVAACALALPTPWLQIVFLGSIVTEMAAAARLSMGCGGRPVHRAHLVERVGLFSIILLGESVISMLAGLRDVSWDAYSITAAASGFLLLCALWWIYFDSFGIQERAKRDRHGIALLYSSLPLVLGLGALAATIGHAVRGDLAAGDFRVLAVCGVALFYVGKQISYWVIFPPYRGDIVRNTTVTMAITVAATFLPRIEFALVGVTVGMFWYTFANFHWTLKKDASAFVEGDDAWPPQA